MTERDSREVFESSHGGQVTPEAARRSVSPRSSEAGESHQSPRRVQGIGESVDSSERGLVSARRGHRSPVPRLDLRPRGLAGSRSYYGEQVPSLEGTVRGRGGPSHPVVSSSDGIEVEDGSASQQAQNVVRPSEYQMNVDNFSDTIHQDVELEYHR